MAVPTEQKIVLSRPQSVSVSLLLRLFLCAPLLELPIKALCGQHRSILRSVPPLSPILIKVHAQKEQPKNALPCLSFVLCFSLHLDLYILSIAINTCLHIFSLVYTYYGSVICRHKTPCASAISYLPCLSPFLSLLLSLLLRLKHVYLQP